MANNQNPQSGMKKVLARFMHGKVSGNTAPADLVNNEARVVGLKDYKLAAATLADAFSADDVAKYFLHTSDTAHWSEERKWNLHVKMMEYITYAHCMNGLVVSAGPNFDCVALWMPPGKNMDDLWTILRSGMWRLSWQLSAEGRARFFKEFLPLLNHTKTLVLGEHDLDSWYLVYLGTKSSSRGKGYARKTVDFVTKQADQEERMCYLESSHAENQKIYERLGFESKKVIHLQRGEENITLDIMQRKPHAVFKRVDSKAVDS